MRASLSLPSVLFAIVACGCGSSTPTAPPNTTVNQIDILGDRGSQSFTPNPSGARQGSMVVWRNTDNVVHHIVFNDGSLDSGDIAPGATTAQLRVGTNGANYHCTIHPGMVGSINRSEGTPPPCNGPYC